ncbi:DUF294 nucleotidyltransferase-like domain-containing protein [Litorisediminicola beolgyonensis]|uniref:DUF294 nucleotidyltransferase-like domain-containing protein n=1 Tax=Litorisediminicola beolgyonensis TaxID=1173614 RepID=A0ABW3ZNW0_9RHOB
MTGTETALAEFLETLQPYADLPPDARQALAAEITTQSYSEGDTVYSFGVPLTGLYIVRRGEIEVRDEYGAPVSILGPRNSFGERGLARDGLAATTATATQATELLILPAESFRALIDSHETARRFFDRARKDRPRRADLATSRVETLMSRRLVTAPPDTTAQDAARRMHDAGVSSLCITEGDTLTGIVTIRDLSARIVAEGRSGGTPVSEIMTADPITLPPQALGSDVLHMMVERRIGHLPVTEGGRLVGIVTQTDLTRWQAVSSAEIVSEIVHCDTVEAMAEVTARIPQLLVQLVASGLRHDVVTRLITDIADAATRRLLKLAHDAQGDAPVRYVWCACGSQGRQEQTGVSDQDNCLILSDDATEADLEWFAEFARFISDGLHACGYVYCPGDMMATNPRWCQPVRVWRDYFHRWINRPVPEAQMLASVMFDLRPIGGELALFDALQHDTLEDASKNSIFVSHMISNSLKHQPPLGLIRSFATIRSGEHKNTLDLKHNGVVPITDLARVYAIRGALTAVNTRRRIEEARARGLLSQSGGQGLLDAYDLIAETRLEHQCTRIGNGEAPDNYLAPSTLSDFDRSHLRDAFVVVKGLQSALGHGRGMLG